MSISFEKKKGNTIFFAIVTFVIKNKPLSLAQLHAKLYFHFATWKWMSKLQFDFITHGYSTQLGSCLKITRQCSPMV